MKRRSAARVTFFSFSNASSASRRLRSNCLRFMPLRAGISAANTRYRSDQSDLGAFLPVFAPKVHRAGPVMRDTRPAGLIFIALTASRRFAESHAADPNNDTQPRGNAVTPAERSSRPATATATIASCLTMALMSSAAIAQPGPGRAFASDPRAEDRTYHFEDTDEDLP